MIDLTTGPDPWFAQDKYQHFAGSAAIATAVTGFTKSEQTGFWTAVGVGAAKEIWDKHQPNHKASWRDFAWDVAGAYAGAKLGGFMFYRDQTGYNFTYSLKF